MPKRLRPTEHYVLFRKPIFVKVLEVPHRIFRLLFQKSVPHRPRWTERRFGKRIRLYEPKERVTLAPKEFLEVKRLVPEKLRPEIEVLREWLKTTLWYECGFDPRSWHIDMVKVSPFDRFRNNEIIRSQEQEDYCFKYLSKGFTKAILEGGFTVYDFSLLERYTEYPYVNDVLSSMGIWFESVVETDGKEEELLELWRCREKLHRR